MTHTILMAAKDGSASVTYPDVVSYEGRYGCLTVLSMSDGSTATFDKDEWDMYDLTPSKGWNSKATVLPIIEGNVS